MLIRDVTAFIGFVLIFCGFWYFSAGLAMIVGGGLLLSAALWGYLRDGTTK